MIKNVVEESFASLVHDLQDLEFSRNLHDEQEGYINRALEWVQTQQNPDGSWGQGVMIDIELALQGFGIWGAYQHSWKIRDGREGGISIAFGWLEINQDNNGCWDNNLWDTAAIIQAAYLLGEGKRACIQNALDWLARRKETRWGVDDRLGLHYIAQSLMAFIMADISNELTSACKGVLIDELRRINKEPSYSMSPYAMGQVLEALVYSGVNPSDELLQPTVNYLEEFLDRAQVSISNFMHICAAFKGLGVVYGGANIDNPTMQLTLGKMFHPTRFRKDGSWYRDMTMTGWALVALRSLKVVRKIEAYPFQIYSLVSRTQRQIEEHEQNYEKIKRKIFLYSVLSTLLATVLGILLLSNTLLHFSLFDNVDLLYFIIGIVVSLLIYTGRQLIKEMF